MLYVIIRPGLLRVCGYTVSKTRQPVSLIISPSNFNLTVTEDFFYETLTPSIEPQDGRFTFLQSGKTMEFRSCRIYVHHDHQMESTTVFLQSHWVDLYLQRVKECFERKRYDRWDTEAMFLVPLITLSNSVYRWRQAFALSLEELWSTVGCLSVYIVVTVH